MNAMIKDMRALTRRPGATGNSASESQALANFGRGIGAAG